MAELHGRVLGFPNRETVATRAASAPSRELRAGIGLALVVALLASAVGHAQPVDAVDDAPLLGTDVGPAIGVEELERLAGELRHDTAAVREHAIARLGTLPASALPAITARVRYLSRLVIPPEDGEDALQRFRHATGSRRADDMIDVAPGIGAVLADDRSATVGRTAERVLLLRSLEQIGTLDAWRVVADVYALSPEMWRWELRRAVVRLGPRLLPALVLARGHRDAALRRWARDGSEALRLTNPADAMQNDDPAQLTMLVTAYSEVRDLDAMPVIAGLVDHPDPLLREASRLAMERYGQNGVWQLRIAFRNKLASEADLAWGWRRTMTELWTRLDEVRLAPQSARIDAARVALDEGRVADAQTELELVLRETPTPPRAPEIAAMLAAIAERVDDAEAVRLLRRATWLAPDDAGAATWRVRLGLLEAEADRARGVLDLAAYEAAAVVPTSEAERARIAAVLDTDDPEDLTTSDDDAHASESTMPWLPLLVLIVASLGAAAFWWRRRMTARESHVGSEATAGSEAQVGSDATARSHAQVGSHAHPLADARVEPSASSESNASVNPKTGVGSPLASLAGRARAMLAPLVRCARAMLAPLARRARALAADVRTYVLTKLAPPIYGPAPKRPKPARPRAELDPSFILGAFAAARVDAEDSVDTRVPSKSVGALDAAHSTIDEDGDDDESFDFDVMVATLASNDDDGRTLADVAFEPASDARGEEDPDALLASLLLGADPNDTLPGAPAPQD